MAQLCECLIVFILSEFYFITTDALLFIFPQIAGAWGFVWFCQCCRGVKGGCALCEHPGTQHIPVRTCHGGHRGSETSLPAAKCTCAPSLPLYVLLCCNQQKNRKNAMVKWLAGKRIGNTRKQLNGAVCEQSIVFLFGIFSRDVKIGSCSTPQTGNKGSECKACVCKEPG